MTRTATLAPLLAAAVIGCAPGSSGESIESRAQRLESPPVAISGQWEGTFSTPRAASVTPPSTFILAQGEGSATSIGDFTLTIPHTVNMVDFHLVGQYFILPKTNPDGTDVMQIDLDEVCRLGTPSICEGTGTISGGTGKFVNAKGTVAIRAEIDFVTVYAKGVFNGTVTY